MEGKGKGKGYAVSHEGLRKLFDLLSSEYELVGPALKEGVISYKVLRSFEELPFGCKSMELAGYYAVEKADGYFTYVRPSNSLKTFLHPPELTIMRVKRENGKLSFEYEYPDKKYCFFDVRACDLSALKVLDMVFLHKNKNPDPYYASLREKVFIVAVNCTNHTNTCFCTTMGTGPEVKEGYDFLITELDGRFLLEEGSERGRRLLESLENKEEARQEDYEEKERRLKKVESSMKRAFETEGLKERLYGRMEESFWEPVGKRCLACTACTQSCPTCFCFDLLERASLDVSERVRVWDSCFSPSFATLHRFNLRQSVHSRYRQWLMHKFAYWLDQFGTFGCVGCGRCISWCPAGIDLREEVKRVAYG